MDEFRIFVVLCGKSHISINDMHRFTIDEAEALKDSLEKKLKDKLSSSFITDEEKAVIEWKLATLEIKELVEN